MNRASDFGRMVAAATSVSGTGRDAAAMLGASQGVIAARTEIMAAAVASPLTADYRELARMAPEKIEAFAKAGSAASGVLIDQGAAWMQYGRDITLLMLRGRTPTASEAAGLFGRWTGLMIGSVEASARLASVTLAPLQKQVRANARRLNARRPAG